MEMEIDYLKLIAQMQEAGLERNRSVGVRNRSVPIEPFNPPIANPDYTVITSDRIPNPDYTVNATPITSDRIPNSDYEISFDSRSDYDDSDLGGHSAPSPFAGRGGGGSVVRARDPSGQWVGTVPPRQTVSRAEAVRTWEQRNPWARQASSPAAAPPQQQKAPVSEGPSVSIFDRIGSTKFSS